MCDEAVQSDTCALWYKGYEQRKAQHPDRWWNWCVPEHEKKEVEIYFA